MLEVGLSPVSLIAKIVGLPRSSVYVILDRLKKMGLIEEYKQKGKIFVKTVSPEDLQSILLRKQQSIKRALKDYEENLNFLKEMDGQFRLIPKVEFLEGKKGVLKAYGRVLKEKFFYSYFNPEAVKQFAPEIFSYIPENMKKVAGIAKELVVDGHAAKEYKSIITNPLHEVKLLPKGFHFSSDNIICENKIFLFSYDKDQVSVVEITNKNLAETQMRMFELLWSKI